MKPLALVIPLVLGVPAGAQLPPHVVVPPGFESTEGTSSMSILGALPYTRVQLAEGGLHGRVTVIKRVGFRHAYLAHYLFASNGRSFSKVRLAVAPCEVAKISATFSKNALLSPRVVYDAKVSWPTQKGLPKVRPAPFDVTLSFPFNSTLVHVGVQDLLLDFTFSGGTLQNAQPWPAAQSQPYLLDAAFLPGVGNGKTTQVGKPTCQDSGLSTPADCRLSVFAYGNDPRSPTTSNKFLVSMYTTGIPPGPKVLHALGSTGSLAGVDIRSCNRLFVSPLVYFYGTSSTTRGLWNNTIGYFPYDAKLVGAQLWGQGAWNDSRNSVLKLTPASQTYVPQQPAVAISRRYVYHWDPKSTTGYLNIVGLSALAIIQYSTK